MSVCVRIIINAMSWNSYSENPFHRKNDLIEFELSEVQHLLSFRCLPASLSHLLSFHLVYFCIILASVAVAYWICKMLAAHSFSYFTRAKKKVDHDSTWDIQVRERVSISWNYFSLYLSIYLTIYLLFRSPFNSVSFHFSFFFFEFSCCSRSFFDNGKMTFEMFRRNEGVLFNWNGSWNLTIRRMITWNITLLHPQKHFDIHN